MGQPRVDITPEAVDTAARNFATGQQDLISAYQRLSGALNAHSSGMAGDDKAAQQFAALYEPAARAAYQAFGTAIEALGGTSLGLTQTINNHLAADHHSRADHPGSAPPQYPSQRVSTSFAVEGSPPGVTGFNWAPNITVPRLRLRVPHLPGWLEAIIGSSPHWPQGNDQMLDEASNAWHEAASEIGRVASWLNWTITTILDPTDNDEYTAVSNYWASLYRPADSTTVLSGLSTMCAGLANACHDYAAATRKATDIVSGETIVEIIALLGAGAAGRLIGRPLRPVLARVGAFMLRSVASIGTRYALREVLADLTKAIVDTKPVKAIKAVFTRNVDRALSKELAQTDKDWAKFDAEHGYHDDYLVTDPTDPGRSITDIDHFEDGTLWEYKSATNAPDPAKWAAGKIGDKFNRYLEARQHLPGYEQAPIGFRFTRAGATPEFRSAVEAEIARLQAANPNVVIKLEWS